jgi:hypothetical protein
MMKNVTIALLVVAVIVCCVGWYVASSRPPEVTPHILTVDQSGTLWKAQLVNGQIVTAPATEVDARKWECRPKR